MMTTQGDPCQCSDTESALKKRDKLQFYVESALGRRSGRLGRRGEPGADGTGHRAAAHTGRHYLRTVFLSAEADLRWAFTAWRSIRYGASAPA